MGISAITRSKLTTTKENKTKNEKSEVRYCHKQRTGAQKGWNMNKAAGAAGWDVNLDVGMEFSASFRF